MQAYKKIETVNDIEIVALVSQNENIESITDAIFNVFQTECKLFPPDDETIEYLLDSMPDILFICSTEPNCHDENFRLCSSIRECGYEGVILLVTNDASECGGILSITSRGFDNYLLISDSHDRIVDTIQWGIINRKRRNKFTIQFDNHPDILFTVDKEGRIYDLNKCATEDSSFSPKEVVNKYINISELGILECFESLIKPLITVGNRGKTFIDELCGCGESIFQVRTKIHNVSMMGLVATVVKTDITKTIYSHTMDILVHSVNLLSQRDNYTASHSARVFYYCTNITKKLGLSRNRNFIRDLYFAAILHDIGKIGIRDKILLKPSCLTKNEFNELITHTVKGYNLLQPYRFLKSAGELVRSHHERPDGMGYPGKIKGNKIPLGSRIIMVADSFDAMTTPRPYRKELSFEKATSEIRENLGTQFDREVGEAFLSIITPSLVKEVKNTSKKSLGLITQELVDTILK